MTFTDITLIITYNRYAGMVDTAATHHYIELVAIPYYNNICTENRPTIIVTIGGTMIRSSQVSTPLAFFYLL